MNKSFGKFESLHRGAELFVLPNVWNAKSALVFQQSNYPAVATSSAAVASSLGYGDGEEMPFEEYLFIIRRIQASIQIPLSVDLEMGYGRSTEEVFANIVRLVQLGVAGINIEDSAIIRGRVLKDARVFARMIEEIRTRLTADCLELFINLRCDTYLLDVPDKEKETRSRLSIYEACGADGIFLPCISKEEDIAEAVNATKLPLNVMAIPGLPGVKALNRLGVKRASTGPFLFNKIYATAGELAPDVF
jgi:2-methylisocitrate lyase-like PEP mutase family enzyme